MFKIGDNVIRKPEYMNWPYGDKICAVINIYLDYIHLQDYSSGIRLNGAFKSDKFQLVSNKGNNNEST